ncbi:hypothetical protein BGZ70_002910 [Mortierella alpina]|uniref:DUF427 domain-containing protein n=1 Tax=Mortierella alpina TaxID=64518 RepID=A0A9P6IV32_MORAP|nr:hypothetical protein BGZ70_002910 [Mortierella alpina]
MTRATATWNGKVLAETDTFETVEGNIYFPASSIHKENFKESSHETVCGWKGTASYYDIVVDDKVNKAAAWYYANPKEAAKNITAMVAFWKGIEVKS